MSRRKIRAMSRMKQSANQSLVDRLLRSEIPPNSILEAGGRVEAQYQIDFVVKSGGNGTLNVKGTATALGGSKALPSGSPQLEDLKKVLASAPGIPEDLTQRLFEASEKVFQMGYDRDRESTDLKSPVPKGKQESPASTGMKAPPDPKPEVPVTSDTNPKSAPETSAAAKQESESEDKVGIPPRTKTSAPPEKDHQCHYYVDFTGEEICFICEYETEIYLHDEKIIDLVMPVIDVIYTTNDDRFKDRMGAPVQDKKQIQCMMCEVQEVIHRECGVNIACPVNACSEVIHYAQTFAHLLQHHPNMIEKWYGTFKLRESREILQKDF
ncbi:hypothetical protein QR680_011519 [Steinernema hermaphroditum]|uniref:Uncharacterized protein n=1 Tax=Steinernema hermaphroditum TaxID=289476 RepID=A0AA39I172_9BILA|nr:hypothetical protein QR680_011519 [Steinernema hermaphroditum]